MRKSRFSDEQIFGILKEHAAGEATVTLCRRRGISQQTLFAGNSSTTAWQGTTFAA